MHHPQSLQVNISFILYKYFDFFFLRKIKFISESSSDSDSSDNSSVSNNKIKKSSSNKQISDKADSENCRNQNKLKNSESSEVVGGKRVIVTRKLTRSSSTRRSKHLIGKAGTDTESETGFNFFTSNLSNQVIKNIC